jgi:membrane protease YdiL (CAAX protease family)
MLGMILFGIIPVSLSIFLFDKQFPDYGLSISFTIDTLYLTTGIGTLLVILNALAAKKSNNLKNYPQIQTKRWTKKLLLLSAIGWTGYIFSYELLFRGILLSESMAVFGVESAIAINILLYALVHIPKGFNETIGSILFGITLCIITIYTGTIWVAFFTHTLLALSNEWFSIYYNSEMMIVKAN